MQTMVYALLADGRPVQIRPATPADFDAVKAMHEAMSPENVYLRFFSFSRLSAETEARRVCAPRPGRVALLAVQGEGEAGSEELVGVASYETTVHDQTVHDQTSAEIAFAVADDMHHKGVATLLLEHLVSAAVSHQVKTFTAQTLDDNTPMLRVFRDAGLPVHRRLDHGVVHVTMALPGAGENEQGTGTPAAARTSSP
jgi:GNAT superfamily N-acetyltransferase